MHWQIITKLFVNITNRSPAFNLETNTKLLRVDFKLLSKGYCLPTIRDSLRTRKVIVPPPHALHNRCKVEMTVIVNLMIQLLITYYCFVKLVSLKKILETDIVFRTLQYVTK